MESNSNDNYVLVLEDRTEVKNENDAGKLSVVSGIDDKGKLQTTEAKDVHQAAFLKFNNKDGLLKNFMTNFLKQFSEPSRFGLYKVVANNVEQGVASLHTMLQNREKPENKQQLAESQVHFEDFLPKQKNATAIDDKGKLQTTEAKDVHQAAFLKFNNKDGLLKNFMTNFLKQFNEPSRFGLYKVVANNVEQSVASLHTMLQNREKPENKQQLADSQVRFDDFLPKQKNATAIDESKIDWKQLDNLGLTRERLEQGGELEKMLSWQKSNLVTIAIPMGDTTIYTDARLAFRTDGEGNIGLAIHPLRKEPQLDYPYMGYKFSPEEKEQLLTTGNLGKTIDVTPKNGEPFSAYVSIDSQTNEIIALRADRVNIPKEIKGVTLSDVQYKDLVEGKAVKVEGMTAKSGKSFDATLQVNAERKGIEFIFDNNKSLRERQEHKQAQQQGVPHKLCGLELSEKQREALDSGRTLYLKNMVDKQGQSFNAYVRMDKEQNRPRFYKWNPDKKQETGKEKVVAVAEEHKTQVAVNNHGKTNEATKNVKEPLKTGQTQPTAEQKQKQDENKQKKSRGRRM